MTPNDSLQAELEDRLRFEPLIADLSSRFISLPVSQVDQEIKDAQRCVCECLGLDASSLYQPVGGAPGMLTLTHFYRALESPALSKPLDGKEYLPWCLAQVLAGKVVLLSSLTQLPPEAARDRRTMNSGSPSRRSWRSRWPGRVKPAAMAVRPWARWHLSAPSPVASSRQ